MQRERLCCCLFRWRGFYFQYPHSHPSRRTPPSHTPQRIWVLRKQWSAVRDAALGSDGSLIICTQSGHVFVRSRSGSSKAPRFVRVTGLQRVIAVRTSDTGALAALREPYLPLDITPVGNNLAEDVSRLRPYFSFTRPEHDGIRIEPKLGCSLPAGANILPGSPR
ncbi:hypothetical protein F5148DRAFT_151381 [Russula earlei]|uniref:Uncharacterized protein n=1 Tax=Russula earlei TaxID=71964 RepID=A0ACC0U7D5_9AGAM|nr:hypothetical protein F5148DRAFT_151381 [Russula earlei]